MSERSVLDELLAAAALHSARADRLASRALRATQALAEGFFSNALSVEAQTRLSGSLYDDRFRPGGGPDGLMSWERTWFDADLPAAPARVLVCAAGAGRESLALLDRGYEVDAFDPSGTAVRHAREAFDGRARIVEASYSDLGGPKLSFLHSSYDAVLLGWGSLSHVVSAEERSALFREVDALAGSGVVLASFYMGDANPKAPGRAARLGARLGRMVAARRTTSPEPVDLTSWGGFVRSYMPDEIEALAASVGRRVDWHVTASWPHVTLRRSA